jgi:hypothetical protein
MRIRQRAMELGFDRIGFARADLADPEHRLRAWLDRGFHVLLTATPEARRVLDYDALDLRAFEPGALVRREGRFRQVWDPWRRPLAGLEGSALGHLGDQLRALRLRSRVTAGPLEALWRRGEVSVREALDVEGFSDGFIEAS